MNTTYKPGDMVFVDGYTSIAQQNFRKSPIQEVDIRYDEKTGEKFEIYQVDGDWYDGRDGSAYNNGESMYYIEFIEKYSIPIYENGVKTEFTVDGEVGDENFKRLIDLTPEGRLPEAIGITIPENIRKYE